MPKLPSYFFRSVIYLYETREHAEQGKPFGGTGFLVGEAVEGRTDGVHVFAVTNWHVAVSGGASVVRVNKLGGGVDIFELDPSDWTFVPKGHDLAIAPIPVSIDAHDVSAVDVKFFLTEADVEKFKVGVGEDAFMVGRFVDHDGVESNVPAVRFGHISVMPQAIRQFTGAEKLKSFVLDMHSRRGYSGSPVYVYRTYQSDLAQGTPEESGEVFIKLLGIHWGQFQEEWKVHAGRKGRAESDILRETDDERFIQGLSGMTMVIPAWDIAEMLKLPKIIKAKQRDIEELERFRGPAT